MVTLTWAVGVRPLDPLEGTHMGQGIWHKEEVETFGVLGEHGPGKDHAESE